MMLQGWYGWGVDHAHGIYKSLPLFYCLAPKKLINSNCERGCEGKLTLRSRVKLAEGGLSHISVRGYIIISKVNI